VTFIGSCQIGWIESNRRSPLRFAPLGMTKWGIALPCNVVDDGWVERKSSGDPISYAPQASYPSSGRGAAAGAPRPTVRRLAFTMRVEFLIVVLARKRRDFAAGTVIA
jgi:hypothetical protein